MAAFPKSRMSFVKINPGDLRFDIRLRADNVIIIARFYSLTNVAMLLLRSDSNSYSLLVGFIRVCFISKVNEKSFHFLFHTR